MASGKNISIDSEREGVPEWGMRPDLHDSISCILDDISVELTFHERDEEISVLESQTTSITGEFSCETPRCRFHTWESGKITIAIRLYTKNEYNVRIYHQRCRKCTALSRPRLNETYAERVAYRLAKWHGANMEAPRSSGKLTGRHLKEFCEGCKTGLCKVAKDWWW